MKNQRIKQIKKILKFLEIIKEEAKKNELVFIFWDINETIITADVGINSKINKSFKIIKKLSKPFKGRTQEKIFNYFKSSYYKSPLSIYH